MAYKQKNTSPLVQGGDNSFNLEAEGFLGATATAVANDPFIEPVNLQAVFDDIMAKAGQGQLTLYRGYQIKDNKNKEGQAVAEKWKYVEDAQAATELAKLEAMFSDACASTYRKDVDAREDKALAYYITDAAYFDFDADDLGEALKAVIKFIDKLEDKGVNPECLRIFASGSKGFHLYLSMETFKLGGVQGLTLNEMNCLPEIMKEFAWGLAVDGLDLRVYTRGRMFRRENIQRVSGKYKVPLSYAELKGLDVAGYEALVSKSRLDYPVLAKPEYCPDLAVEWDKAKDKVVKGKATLKKRASVPITEEISFRVKTLLDVYHPDGGGYSGWFKGVSAIHDTYAGSAEGFEVAKNWSMKSNQYDLDELESTWDGLYPGVSGGITFGSLVFEVRKNKIVWIDPHPELNPNHDVTVNPEATPFKLTEVALAEFLKKKYGDRLIWMPDAPCWMAWDGKKWVEEDGEKGQGVSKLVVQVGRELCGRCLAEVDSKLSADGLDDAEIKLLQKQKANIQKFFDNTVETERGLNSLLKNMQRWFEHKDQAKFDSQPFKINTQNGILDLHTKELKPHDPEQGFTLITGVNYNPDAECPKFLKFLEGINQVDSEWGEFLLDQLAYGLTGDISVACSYWWVGGGANGKSTLTKVLSLVMGTFAHTVPIETFLVARKHKSGNEATPSINSIHGARMLFSTEMSKGAQLNDATLKTLVSSDDIPARRLYSNKVYKIRPVFKFYPFFNDLPVVAGTDNGVWRRIAKMEFKADFEKKDADKRIQNLEAILISEESEGIFALLVDRCSKLLQRSSIGGGRYSIELPQPQCVKMATQEYRDSLDPVAEFVRAHIVFDDDYADQSKVVGVGTIPAAALHTSYLYFAEVNGKPKMSSTSFGSEAVKHLEKTRTSQGKVYKGGRIRLDTFPDDYFKNKLAANVLHDKACFTTDADIRAVGGLKGWVSMPDVQEHLTE